uniref:Uncharacterized protein n=1 Tax=Setaria viridis TaxID=4556 RepID=A0A4U6V295_SETVI|nr:hypothetical protein SEVIR_4G160203v2 [Setaria viridis]
MFSVQVHQGPCRGWPNRPYLMSNHKFVLVKVRALKA